MNFNWRDVLMRNIPIDEVVEKIAGLGVPGLVLLVAVAGAPWYGGAAIVTALAALGGPFGMIGGIGAIVLSGFIVAAISRFGFERIFKRVLKKLREQGKTKEEILQEVDGYRITQGLKLKLRDYIENMEGEETDEGEETKSSELSEETQKLLGIRYNIEQLIGEGIDQFESRLNKKIDDVREDINSRIDTLETRLKWFISIAIAVGGIIISGIVFLVVK